MSNAFTGYLLPHPPLLIPAVGKADIGAVAQTQRAVTLVCKEMADMNPDVVFIATPHGPTFGDAIGLSAELKLKGSFSSFGAPQIKVEVDIHRHLTETLYQRTQAQSVSTVLLSRQLLQRFGYEPVLDHGLLVPLYFMQQAGVKCPIVPICVGGLSIQDHYHLGVLLQQVLREFEGEGLFVASGDLSHCLAPGAPAGFSPEGQRFDRFLVDALQRGDVKALLTLRPSFIRDAAECGLKPLSILLGLMDGFTLQTKVLSYEAPFGVGYGVASASAQQPSPHRKLLSQIEHARQELTEMVRAQESHPVKLARQAVELYAKERRKLEVPSGLPEGLYHQGHGVFVSLKEDDQLRGCMGTVFATREHIAAEIIQNALSAAFDDTRFPPIQQRELSRLVYSVDILGEPELVKGPEDLDPKHYGVIVKKGDRQGLLLPDIEGVDTVTEQLEIAASKAGLKDWRGARLLRFGVTRYE